MRIRAKVLIATGVSIVLAGGAWALNRPEPQPVAFTPEPPAETTVVEEPAPAPEPETGVETQPQAVETPEPEFRVCYQDEVPLAIQKPFDVAFRKYLDEYNLANINLKREAENKGGTDGEWYKAEKQKILKEYGDNLKPSETTYEAELAAIGCRRPNDAEFQAWLVRTGRNQ